MSRSDYPIVDIAQGVEDSIARLDRLLSVHGLPARHQAALRRSRDGLKVTAQLLWQEALSELLPGGPLGLQGMQIQEVMLKLKWGAWCRYKLLASKLGETWMDDDLWRAAHEQ